MKIPYIEIIESLTPDPNLLMWKFQDAGQEIKNGAALTVRESQHVMILNEGQLGDIFSPGMYNLTTENIPIITSLKSWKYGFNSPFKVDIYFFNMHQFINLKWGTPMPIIMPDSQFGQVRVRAFGTYNIQISDVAKFFRQYAGTYHQLTVFELERQLRDFIAPAFGEILVKNGYSIIDVAGNITELSNKIRPLIQPLFDELGLALTKFQVSSVTLPDDVLKHYDIVTNMNMIGDIDRFQKFNTASAIIQQDTAVNEGTKTAAMLGAIMGQMNQNQNTQENNNIAAKLKKLKDLFDAELIDEDEFKAKKAELLNQL
ncbi:SPFH domain-containing protein [Dysgonomonas mossii]|uniref:SPFH domain-containing protein n=1 Tax=Dysgonomonas mossii TaxID=163665 RepID=UPI003992342D